MQPVQLGSYPRHLGIAHNNNDNSFISLLYLGHQDFAKYRPTHTSYEETLITIQIGTKQKKCNFNCLPYQWYLNLNLIW